MLALSQERIDIMKAILKCDEFWAMAIAVIAALMLVFGGSEATTAQVVGIVCAVSALVSYILGRCYIKGKMCEVKNILIKEDVE